MRTLSRGRRVGREGIPGRGFTLIELLVAIVIISALIALLLPAVQSSIATSRRAQVQAEISRLVSALADFKAKHGVNPPSSISLYETAADWTGDPRSMGLVRQIFGQQFDFSLDRDINNDGDTLDTLELTKGECLVFFLGGVPDTAANKFAPRGFSQNPANPFLATGSNREGPYFEFDVNRYIDTDSDGMQEFRDTLPNQSQPYFYLSSYDGQGYLTTDAAPLVGPYLQAGTTPWNSQTFQIISPGEDGEYGTGGIFNEETADADLTGARSPERDNIVNFHQGILAPN